MYGVEGVGEQVEQHAPQLLRHHGEVAVGVLQAVVGQAQVVLGQVVQVHGLALAGVGVGVLQHAAHNARGPVAVLVDAEQVLLEVVQQ